MMNITRLLTAATLLVSLRAANAAFSLDDITFWAGDEDGKNRAAMVITWNAPEYIDPELSTMPPPIKTVTMVWGYRFDGNKNAEDMFNAIVAAVPGLFALVSHTDTYGKAVFGIGYDLNNNGTYGLTNGSTTYTASSFQNGLVNNVPFDYHDGDQFVSTDPGDLYWGGWYGPNWECWHEINGKGGFTIAPDRGPDPYWTKGDGWSGYHGEWEYPGNNGMSEIAIYDGSWFGWTVAAAGFVFGDDEDPNSTLWLGHKAAPDLSLLVSVPEPAGLGLLLIGGGSLLVWRRKRVTK